MKEINHNENKPDHYQYLVSDNIEKNIKIEIEQVKQNFGMEFHIKENNQLLYKGYDTFIENAPPVRLEDPSGKIIFKYFHNPADVISIDDYYVGNYGIIKNEKGDKSGEFYQAGYDRNKYYCIEYNSQFFEIYLWSTGRSPHLSIFLNGNQIAQVEQENVITNNLNKYALYLLNDFKNYKDILCLAVIIYDKFEYGNHGEAFYGSKTDVSFNYSVEGIGKDKYFKEFMKLNFPDVEIIHEEASLKTIAKDLQKGWEISKRQNFTKNKYKEFIKISLIPFIIVMIFMVIIFSLMISFEMGLIVLFIGTILGILYYLILKKICKY